MHIRTHAHTHMDVNNLNECQECIKNLFASHHQRSSLASAGAEASWRVSHTPPTRPPHPCPPAQSPSLPPALLPLAPGRRSTAWSTQDETHLEYVHGTKLIRDFMRIVRVCCVWCLHSVSVWCVCVVSLSVCLCAYAGILCVVSA